MTIDEKLEKAHEAVSTAHAAHDEAVKAAYPGPYDFVNHIMAGNPVPAGVLAAYNVYMDAEAELNALRREAEAPHGDMIMARNDHRFLATLARKGFYGESAYHSDI